MSSDSDDTIERNRAPNTAPITPFDDPNRTLRRPPASGHETFDDFEQSGTSVQFSAPARLPSEKAGDRIGRYVLIEKIGQGGFGSVWKAEQIEPVRRFVALKVIKLGMDTHEIVLRFEQERQALALMDHPNIAHVLDAGATETGRPYFVMDLVHGEPLSSYCDGQRKSIAERLELFAQICTAVQHAHTKGIIHRDLKPSNVLVTTIDDRPHATIIDFGIAKATSAKLSDQALLTREMQVIGTLKYMSPEQADGSADIDTRTDIYSLGVMLYELLTGSTPFDRSTMKDAMLYEMQRVIKEVDPPRPSARLSSPDETTTKIAECRKTEVRRLGLMMRGDLDWIVMKAIDKDRGRRYETASDLALDVRRYLKGEAVIAAPPSAIYRTKKFVRRHRTSVAAGGAVLLSLIVGIVGFAWQANAAARARDEAQRLQKSEGEQRAIADVARDAADKARAFAEAQKILADKQKDAAVASAEAERKETKRAIAIVNFVTEALRSGDPNHGGSQQMLVVDAMKRASEKLDDGAFDDDPEIEASLSQTIADILYRNARAQEALPIARRALDLYSRYAPKATDSISQCDALVGTIEQSLGHYAAAEPHIRRALELARKSYKGDHESVSAALNNLGLILMYQGKPADAEPLVAESLAMKERNLTGDSPDIAMSLNNLANIRDQLGRGKDADPLFERSLAMYERLYKCHPELAMAIYNVGQRRSSQGRLVEAEAMLTRSLAMYRELFHGNHPDIARNLYGLASLKKRMGKMSEVMPLFRESIAMSEALYPDGHELTASALTGIAFFVADTQKIGDGEAPLRRALDIQKRLHPGDHPAVAQAMDSLAEVLRLLDRPKEVEVLLKDVLAMQERLHPNGDASVALAMNRLALIQKSVGTPEAAEPLAKEALDMVRRFRGNDHYSTAIVMSGLGRILDGLDRPAEAEKAFAESAAICGRFFGRDHPDTVVALTRLAEERAKLKKNDESRATFDQAIAMQRRCTPDGSRPLSDLLTKSADARVATGDLKTAVAEYEEAMRFFEATLPPDHTRTIETRAALEKCRLLLEGKNK